MEVWNLWHANYWLAGGLKAITAAASVVTSILLVRLVPEALNLPSPSQWFYANAALQSEIRERRELELNLRISESNYREQAELLDLTHDAIFVRSLEKKVIYWNRAAERLYGWQKEEVRGKITHEFLHTIFPKPLAEIQAEVFEKGYWEGELTHTRSDGTPVIVSSRWALRVDSNGKPLSILESNRDITHRKREEEKFRNLLESAPDAMVIVDRAGIIQLINAQTERLFGYSREELLGQQVEILVPQRFHGKHATKRDDYSHSPRPREMGAGLELFGRRKDGSEFPVEVSLSPLDTGDEKLISSAIRDISLRKRAESKFRDLLESAPDAIVIVNDKGLIVLTNAQTENLFGYHRDELLGQPVEILVPKRFQDEHVGQRKVYAHSPRPRSMRVGLDLYGRRKDGTEFPAEISLSPLETEEGTLVSSAIRDVSQQKQTAEALRASEERLQLAMEAAQLGSWDWDLTTDRAIRSLRHDQIFGYDSLQPEWGAEIAIANIISEDRDLFRSRVAEALKTDTFSVEFRIIRAGDHSLRWVSTQGRVYRDAENKPVRMMGIVADTTERKRAEHDLELHQQELARSNAELALANKELESFSYSVSHDLRAPLRHIDGFARILKDEHAAELSAEAQRYLDRILHGANLMGHLVDDMLNLARIGRRELVLQRTKLDALVREAVANLPETENRSIEWRIESLPEVDCDPGLLKLVFTNLLANSLKFTRGRQPAVIEIGSLDEGPGITLFVRDNGVGFDPKYADKLFGVFQRLHRQEDFEGTGVGLATVQRIIHRHGGKVWAKSEIDRGATFFFTLGAQPPVALKQLPVEVNNRV
jgi:PAS domain S-box-containing protein